MANNTFYCWLLLFLIHGSSEAIDYGQLMAKKVKEALGKTYRSYTFSTYPLNNYGLATCYGRKVGPEQLDCATWDCLGVKRDSDLAKMTDEQKLKLIVGDKQYATTGTGKELTLSEVEKKSLGIKALLPKLLKIIGLELNIDQSKKITTNLSMGQATVRTIRRKEMTDLLNSPRGHPLAKQDWANGKLIMVYSDIILNSMKVELTVNPQTDVELTAKLNGALQGKEGQAIGADSNLTFKVNNVANGNYKFEITEPLIIAVYTKKAPRGAVLAIRSEWADEDVQGNKVLEETVDLGDLQ